MRSVDRSRCRKHRSRCSEIRRWSAAVSSADIGTAQIEFLNLLIEHLTEQGVMAASRLYESPFTDLTPAGPKALFTPAQIDGIVAVLDDVRAKAA